MEVHNEFFTRHISSGARRFSGARAALQLPRHAGGGRLPRLSSRHWQCQRAIRGLSRGIQFRLDWQHAGDHRLLLPGLVRVLSRQRLYRA